MTMVESQLNKPKLLVNQHGQCRTHDRLTKHSLWHNFVHGSCITIEC